MPLTPQDAAMITSRFRYVVKGKSKDEVTLATLMGDGWRLDIDYDIRECVTEAMELSKRFPPLQFRPVKETQPEAKAEVSELMYLTAEDAAKIKSAFTFEMYAGALLLFGDNWKLKIEYGNLQEALAEARQIAKQFGATRPPRVAPSRNADTRLGVNARGCGCTRSKG